MEITRRSDYACRILRAAYQAGESYISVTDVAKQENIPYSFARTIQHDLVKEGLLKTSRGAHGGLTLNCDPKETTLLDVLKVVQGDLSVADCTVEEFFCEKKDSCGFNHVWGKLDTMVSNYLASITLGDIFIFDEKGISVTEVIPKRVMPPQQLNEDKSVERFQCQTK